jgi:hypothetical protein
LLDIYILTADDRLDCSAQAQRFSFLCSPIFFLSVLRGCR